MAKTPAPTDEESGAERIGGIVALLFYCVLLVEALGITLIVGLTDITPRSAALMMLLPALFAWVAASNVRRLRSAALSFFPPIF